MYRVLSLQGVDLIYYYSCSFYLSLNGGVSAPWPAFFYYPLSRIIICYSMYKMFLNRCRSTKSNLNAILMPRLTTGLEFCRIGQPTTCKSWENDSSLNPSVMQYKRSCGDCEKYPTTTEKCRRAWREVSLCPDFSWSIDWRRLCISLIYLHDGSVNVHTWMAGLFFVSLIIRSSPWKQQLSVQEIGFTFDFIIVFRRFLVHPNVYSKQYANLD